MSEADQKKFGLEIAQNGIAGILTLTEGAVKFFGYSTKIIATKNVIANSVFSVFDVFDADTAEEKIVQLSGAVGSVVGGAIGTAAGFAVPGASIPFAVIGGYIGATIGEEAFERAMRDVIDVNNYINEAISNWINGPADEAEDAPDLPDTNNATPQESDDNTDAPTIISIDNIGDKRSYFSDMGDQNLSSQGGFDQSSYDANEGFGAPDTAAIDAAIAAEAEAARIAAEEEAARQKAAEEAARQKAVEEEAARIAAEEAARQRELEEQSARQKAAEELAKQRERAAEERRLEEEAARQKAAEEAKKKKQSQDNNSDSGNKGGSGVSWTNSTTDSDWHSTVGGNYPPVLIDLDGDGDITIIHYEDSTILFDGDGDGFGNRAAWVGPQDGFLAYDKDEDGIIRDHDELSFLSYLEGAKTDLEGLAYFDSNQNGLLDQDDDAWHQFHIFQDFNSNGVTDEGELTPLDEMEIVSLTLASDGNARYNDSAYIYGETSFTKSDGTTIAGFDTALEISRTGYALQNFADSVLQLMKDADGHIARAVTYSDDDDHSLSLTDDNNVSSVIGGEGADIFTNDRQAGAVLMGRGGDDVLQGNVGQDILQGGQGDDRLAGGAGNDIYLFNRGDGHDVIYDESSLAEGGDTILFGPDIAASDIMLRRDGWDMVIYLRDEEGLNTDMVDLSDSLRIAAWGFTAHRIETLQFSDGAHIDISDVDGTITDEVLLGDLLEYVSNNADEDPTDSVWYNHQRHYIWSPMAEIRQDTWLEEGDGKASLNTVVHRIIHGTDKVNTLYGGAGNDYLYGGGGRDHLHGRNGSDHVYGGEGYDAIYGHDGHDYLFGGDGGIVSMVVMATITFSVAQVMIFSRAAEIMMF